MFKPNAELESFGNWGTGVQITLADGSLLRLTKDMDTKEIEVQYFTVTSSTTETETAKVHNATSLFDYLFDLTQ